MNNDLAMQFHYYCPSQSICPCKTQLQCSLGWIKFTYSINLKLLCLLQLRSYRKSEFLHFPWLCIDLVKRGRTVNDISLRAYYFTWFFLNESVFMNLLKKYRASKTSDNLPIQSHCSGSNMLIPISVSHSAIPALRHGYLPGSLVALLPGKYWSGLPHRRILIKPDYTAACRNSLPSEPPMKAL